jgi:hypothetical protein
MAKRIDPAGYVVKCNEIIKRLTIRALSELGEQCVTKIRDRAGDKSWYDQTGNLRSSVGYIVLYEGKEVQRGGFMSTSAPEGNGSKGKQEGQNYLEETAKIFAESSGFSLVVVAGMNYAEFVEAMDNKDVIASTELWARGKWEETERKLKTKIEVEIDKLEIF